MSAERFPSHFDVGGFDSASNRVYTQLLRVGAASDDRRSLGICMGRLQLDGTDVVLESEEAALALGWHVLERHPDGHAWRWSGDRVPLPAATRLVVIDIDGPG